MDDKKLTDEPLFDVESELVPEPEPEPEPEPGVDPPLKSDESNLVFLQDLDPNRRLPRTSKYLDEVEREEAEIRRAKLENREPDLENPGPTAGSPLRSKDHLNNPNSNLIK